MEVVGEREGSLDPDPVRISGGWLPSGHHERPPDLVTGRSVCDEDGRHGESLRERPHERRVKDHAVLAPHGFHSGNAADLRHGERARSAVVWVDQDVPGVGGLAHLGVGRGGTARRVHRAEHSATGHTHQEGHDNERPPIGAQRRSQAVEDGGHHPITFGRVNGRRPVDRVSAWPRRRNGRAPGAVMRTDQLGPAPEPLSARRGLCACEAGRARGDIQIAAAYGPHRGRARAVGLAHAMHA